jgi:hypothetical protein
MIAQASRMSFIIRPVIEQIPGHPFPKILKGTVGVRGFQACQFDLID